MTYQWDNKKPTAQMLGRWQPFHDGHYKLFKEIIKKTGQVCIQIRDVQGVDDNPFDFETVKKNIEDIKLIADSLLKKDNENKSNAETTAQNINSLKFTKEIAAKDNGELYGSLSISDIVTFLSENSISIQKKSIKLGNKIKTTGEHSVEIDLHPEVDCSLSIEILSPKSSS